MEHEEMELAKFAVSVETLIELDLYRLEPNFFVNEMEKVRGLRRNCLEIFFSGKTKPWSEFIRLMREIFCAFQRLRGDQNDVDRVSQ